MEKGESVVDTLNNICSFQMSIVILNNDLDMANWMCSRAFEPMWILYSISSGRLVEDMGCLFQLYFAEFLVKALARHVEWMISP